MIEVFCSPAEYINVLKLLKPDEREVPPMYLDRGDVAVQVGETVYILGASVRYPSYDINP